MSILLNQKCIHKETLPKYTHMYVYIYIYIYIYTHTHTHSHTYIQVFGRVFIHIQTIYILDMFIFIMQSYCNGYCHLEMDTMTLVQILDEVAFILNNSNSLGKGMNPYVFSSAMSKM